MIALGRLPSILAPTAHHIDFLSPLSRLCHLTKLELATNYVRVLETLEPGLSKFRAKFMFEMIDTKMFLFCEKFKQEQIVEQSEIRGKWIKILREYKTLILSLQNTLTSWMM